MTDLQSPSMAHLRFLGFRRTEYGALERYFDCTRCGKREVRRWHPCEGEGK